MIRAFLLSAVLSQAPVQPHATPHAANAPVKPAAQAAPAAQDAPATPHAPATQEAPAAAAPAPYQGTLAQGFAELQSLAQAGKKDEALALADALLAPNTLLRWKLESEHEPGWSVKGSFARAATPVADFLGWSGRTSEERAAVEYARGVVHALAHERQPADDAFQRARADGHDELRLASIYNLGSLALEQGEEWRQKIPEVSGQKAPPPAPPAPNASGAPPAKEPDPLQEARKSYLAARERFLERLRAQWDDADTRADVELVQRRLKQLDEIEKKRKQQEQQQKDKDKQDKDKQDQEKKDQDKNDKDKQDKDKSDKQDQDKDKQDPGKPQQPPPDPKDGDKDKQDQKQSEPPKPEDKPKDEGDKQEQAQAEKQQEVKLSKEEMTRLLDKLQQLEEQAEKIRQQIHQARKVTVKKDW